MNPTLSNPHQGKILITGGRVIDPRQNLDKITPILIQDGKIHSLGNSINASGSAKKIDARGFGRNRDAARIGGRIAGGARKNLENQLGGESVVSKKNFLKEPPKPKGLPDGIRIDNFLTGS